MEAPDDIRALLERVMRERDELAARLDQIEGRGQRAQPEGNALDGMMHNAPVGWERMPFGGRLQNLPAHPAAGLDPIMQQLPSHEGKMQNAPAYMDVIPNPLDGPRSPPKMQMLPGRMGPAMPLSEREDRRPAYWDANRDGPIPGYPFN